ncbi:CaiB/BaiF CoA transferase family protein [Arthrobacter sp. C152]|nr:formyl-CoA transferase [Arthrobacter sp. B2I5]
MSGPLSGMRVLDIATVFAGPFAAALLGDMGATVLKVEMPGVGDPLRALGPFQGDTSLTWAAAARNKQSMTLDLKSSEGQEVLIRLLAEQDILIENFRPGTLDKWGLSIDRLRAANPNLIVVRISGYGQTGPFGSKAGFGTPATAFSGYAHINGYPDRPPVLPSVSLVDYLTGMFGALGALAAVYQLKVSGGPAEEVDAALYESIFRMLEVVVAEYDVLGTVRERTGNELAASCPAGIYQAKDGHWVVITTSTERTFARLAEAMDRPDMLTDPRYSTNRERLARRTEMNELVSAWTGTYTREELQKRLDDFSVPHSLVYDVADIFKDEHYAARDMLVEVSHPTLGSVTLPGVVPKFSENPGSIRSAGPLMGEHTTTVLTELGYTAEQIADLELKGIV